MEVFKYVIWTAGSLYVIFSVILGLAMLADEAHPDIHGWISKALSFFPPRGNNIVLKAAVLTSPGSDTVRSAAKSYIFSLAPPQKLPEVYIQPRNDVTGWFDSEISIQRKLFLLGRGGLGKTTFALELRRRYVEMDGTSPTSRIPLYISLSRTDLNTKSSLTNLVSRAVATDRPHLRKWITNRMMKSGSLLFILDNVDRLDKQGREGLELLIHQWQQNAFLCISSAKPFSEPFLEDFRSFELPEWNLEDLEHYVSARIRDPGGREDLLTHIRDWKTLQRPLTPLECECIVDTYVKGDLFKLIQPRGLEGPEEYRILDSYLRIVITNLGIEYEGALKKLGRLSLRLYKQGRDSFVSDEAQIPEPELDLLNTRLFTRSGGIFTFVHPNHQVLLAGKFLGQFWQEARAELLDPQASTLVWTPVYACASKFISADGLEDLHTTFRKLTGNSLEARLEARSKAPSETPKEGPNVARYCGSKHP